MTNPAPITLDQLFRFYRGLPHQLAAIVQLEEDIRANGYEVALRRDRPWFSVWSQAGKQEEAPAPSQPQVPAWVPAAAQIVKEFEGCRLTAYPDPGTGGDPWTIGVGHTGPEVKPGVVITQQQADAYLAQDMQEAADALFRLVPAAAGWRPNQQAALISFGFNVGTGALEGSTLRKRLLAGEDPAAVVRAELPKWNKGGGGELPGLTRRRAAEVALFLASPQPATTGQQAKPAGCQLQGFPWFPQLDNGPEGWRQCQTSSIAMCLAYLKTPGINDDTDYLRIVQRYGDTTNQATHQKALKELGVRARFVTDCTPARLQAELNAGLPTAIGMLHHGPVLAPSGGGHYLAVHGFSDTAWLVNDPYGELDLVAGTWARQGGDSGRDQRYSFRNLNPRWLADGPESGWAWLFS